MSLALGVAALCGLSVFFLLCERDHSFLRQISLYDAATYVTQSTANPRPAPVVTAASDTNTTAVQGTTVQSVPGYIPFDLPRSRRFQRVGPISVGVWRTDSRHGFYDIGVMVEGQRFEKKHVGTDEALAIRIGNAPPMEFVVNRVSRNQVSGYLRTSSQVALH